MNGRGRGYRHQYHVGFDPEESPEMAALVKGLGCQVPLLVDLNYGRRKNFWREWALRHKHPFMNGLSTLVHQARRSFLLWTGIQMPAEEFRQVLDHSSRLSSMKL